MSAVTDPLVVIPGFMADARSFLPQLVQLGASRLIVLILPTQGESVEQISKAALPMLPPKFALLGHGLGGAVAIDILRRMPNAVARIALIATDPLTEPPQTAAAREIQVVAAKSGKLAEAMTHEIPLTALAETQWREDVMALVQDMAAGLGPDQFQRQSRALQRRPDQQKTLRSSKVPALILAGAADTIVPVRRAEFLAGLMPSARLHVIEAAGHLPQLEQPEAVSKVLAEFLAGPLLLR
ncbi:alpha/beta fold hydrolase [Tabrizicola sp.]|uniref:alpha/beta fold hydrolase n=1 Tax=Tabrizicola sp. TaxID=2005166 RepID=UPI00286CA455|nr:alpha/beta fold hydrolase [Tabrizicola sp.]